MRSSRVARKLSLATTTVPILGLDDGRPAATLLWEVPSRVLLLHKPLRNRTDRNQQLIQIGKKAAQLSMALYFRNPPLPAMQ